MRRAVLASAAALSVFALGGCGHLSLPYLPGDRSFRTRDEAAVTPPPGAASPVDPVQHARASQAGGPPPCKFGGTRCPPWERAWPAASGLTPADRVDAAGAVKRAATPAN